MIHRIIKANTYFPVSSEPFEMPVPVKLELYYINTLLCIYSVTEDLTVDYSYNTTTEIPLLTPKDKMLKISDIYYLLRSRVFPDNPFTAPAQLAQLGLTEYNPYEIVMKTHGILPMNPYWIKRADEILSYEEANAAYNELMFGAPQEKPQQDGGIEDFLGMND